MTTTGHPGTTRTTGLTEAQVRFFRTFGYLHLPQLLGDSIERITRGFEAVFADPSVARWTTEDPDSPIAACRPLHHHLPRTVVPDFLERHPDLAWLATDPSLADAATALLGPHRLASSDGNLMWCPTSWHVDAWETPLDVEQIKVFLYLDPLEHDTGALRVVPTSHALRRSTFGELFFTVLDPTRIEELLGVDPEAIPSHTVATTPGDVVIIDHRVMHASYGGGPRRRYIAIDFRGTGEAESG